MFDPLPLDFLARSGKANSPFNYAWHRMLVHLLRSDIEGGDYLWLITLRNRLKGWQ